jgi:MFS transporter, DHA3 family, tetracycline resistance protein
MSLTTQYKGRFPSVRKFDAYRVYLTYSAAESLFFSIALTFNIVYQSVKVGLNPLQLVLVGTMLEAMIFFFEVPTGVVADVYSRRLSVIIGVFLLGLSFIVEGSVPVFAAIMASQILLGIGFTFVSGALSAWIADEIGEQRANQAFLRGAQVRQVAGVVGILVSTALATVQVNLPVVIGGIMFLALGIFLMLFMPEVGFHPASKADRQSPRQAMTETLKTSIKAIRSNRIFATILTIAVIYGAFTEGLDRLWRDFMLKNFTLPPLGPLQSIAWFGIIGILSLPVSLVLTEFARRRVNTENHASVARALMIINALLIVSVITFSLSGNFWMALAVFLVIGPLRSVYEPIYTAWINQGLDPQVRATILSIASQTDALGQILGGPVVGMIGNVFSVRAALFAASLALTPVLAIYARTIRRHAPETAVVSVESS